MASTLNLCLVRSCDLLMLTFNHRVQELLAAQPVAQGAPQRHQEAQDRQVPFAQGNRPQVPSQPPSCSARHCQGSGAQGGQAREGLDKRLGRKHVFWDLGWRIAATRAAADADPSAWVHMTPCEGLRTDRLHSSPSPTDMTELKHDSSLTATSTYNTGVCRDRTGSPNWLFGDALSLLETPCTLSGGIADGSQQSRNHGGSNWVTMWLLAEGQPIAWRKFAIIQPRPTPGQAMYSPVHPTQRPAV
ncbi:hypothetical protein B0T11DRAFT_123514 [Plectosphaerella cucumerina]|uniref:Uncharacterized protein n=1 Tax=Plectosphaerella cucumerina TaxID=40658 RepID=A0A8K0T8J9_9PEZI|nr:hypothetical protein B0T11DRAFT_123514 [Plectosphaerella cucumerina]